MDVINFFTKLQNQTGAIKTIHSEFSVFNSKIFEKERKTLMGL